jgi:hypothetical protein
MSNPFINAQRLRFGFFDNNKQYLHITNLRIKTANNMEIQKICKYSQTSTWGSQVGQLRDILVDSTSLPTFCHTNNGPNEHITVDFQKSYPITQIIIENRSDNTTKEVKDRIFGARFKLYDTSDKLIYTSDPIKESSQFYYINTSSGENGLGDNPKIYTGQPPDVVVKPDPNDPCNDPKLIKEKPALKSACDCSKAANAYSDQVKLHNEMKRQYEEVEKIYYDILSNDKKDYEKMINVYDQWGKKKNELQSEQRLFKECQGRTWYTQPQWEYTCVKDYGNGWEFVPGSDSMSGCGWNSRGKCRRTTAQVTKDLNDAGYKLWAPPSIGVPTQPSAPLSTPITCCSQTFDNISTGANGKIELKDIKQECKTEIQSQIENAIKPPAPAAPASKPSSSAAAPAPEPSAAPASSEPSSSEESLGNVFLNGFYVVVAICFVVGIAYYLNPSKEATQEYRMQQQFGRPY